MRNLFTVAAAAFIAGTFALASLSAHAQPRDRTQEWRDQQLQQFHQRDVQRERERDLGEWRGPRPVFVEPPPVYYAPPPQYYAPPAQYYAPPPRYYTAPTYVNPGVTFGFTFR